MGWRLSGTQARARTGRALPSQRYPRPGLRGRRGEKGDSLADRLSCCTPPLAVWAVRAVHGGRLNADDVPLYGRERHLGGRPWERLALRVGSPDVLLHHSLVQLFLEAVMTNTTFFSNRLVKLVSLDWMSQLLSLDDRRLFLPPFHVLLFFR